MFEREVTISGLKKNSVTLSKLVEEIEGKARLNGFDVSYFHEALKKIETDLRKIRKMDEEVFATRIW